LTAYPANVAGEGVTCNQC